MAKEDMKLEEKFSAQVLKTGNAAVDAVAVKPYHKAIGYGLIAAVLGALVWWFSGGAHQAPSKVLDERPGLIETLKPNKVGGVLYLDILRSALNKPMVEFATPFSPKYENTHFGPIPNTIVNEGETALRDCFIATSCTDTQNFKYHGIGTSSAAIAETDGGCTTELTTQYNPDNTRATGSQTNNGANVYRTVGTNTVDASATIEEFCLMATSTGAGNMWTRILTGTISLGNGDGLQTTYDLTIE